MSHIFAALLVLCVCSPDRHAASGYECRHVTILHRDIQTSHSVQSEIKSHQPWNFISWHIIEHRSGAHHSAEQFETLPAYDPAPVSSHLSRKNSWHNADRSRKMPHHAPWSSYLGDKDHGGECCMREACPRPQRLFLEILCCLDPRMWLSCWRYTPSPRAAELPAGWRYANQPPDQILSIDIFIKPQDKIGLYFWLSIRYQFVLLDHWLAFQLMATSQ